MKNIQPFIDMGWHTVPLRGELKRLESGEKTVPKFEKDWRVKYQNISNTVATEIGGVITGEVSGIIAIDCDNDLTYNLFKTLDPDYKFIFMSAGKKGKDGEDKHCGTFVYRYNPDCNNTFSINNGTFALDVYSDKGFVYLPTSANGSKVAWDSSDIPVLGDMPDTIAALLCQLKDAKDGENRVEEPQTLNVMTANCLNPLVSQFVSQGTVLPGLFKIITPRDFRDLPEYARFGYLHPNNVPDGRGSEYMSKVSAILGADISIDEELYVDAMHAINNLFEAPIAKSRLDKTVIDPMINKQASINGKVIWQHESDWNKHRLILTTKRQSSVEVCFDDRRNIYIVVDIANQKVQTFGRDNDMQAYLEAAAMQAPKKAETKRSMPIVNVVSNPGLPFGFSEGADPTARYLNTFIQTPELAIIANPESYKTLYKRPTTTLNFIETLVPEAEMRNFLLGFIKRKLTHFEYSPVVIYFLGVHGSGKDTFVQILEQIMGKVARPTTKEFLEMFNGWLMDSYFVQLDEYGNQLNRIAEKEEALGKIKLYSGKKNVQIRAMRSDGFMYEHSATFIMTANKNPLMLEDGDRRVALMSTPKVLVEQAWVQDAGGVSAVYERIMAEVKDFCFYLATEVPMLSKDGYVKPPESADKRKLVADSMFAAQKLAYCLKHGMLDYLLELCDDFSAQDTAKALTSGNLCINDLEPLYESMTDFNGDMRSLTKMIRAMGINLSPTTKNGEKAYRIEFRGEQSNE